MRIIAMAGAALMGMVTPVAAQPCHPGDDGNLIVKRGPHRPSSLPDDRRVIHDVARSSAAILVVEGGDGFIKSGRYEFVTKRVQNYGMDAIVGCAPRFGSYASIGIRNGQAVALNGATDARYCNFRLELDGKSMPVRAVNYDYGLNRLNSDVLNMPVCDR